MDTDPPVMLRDYSEIFAQLRIAQDEEYRLFGDMGHSYYEQAIRAIQDLEGALMDEATAHVQAKLRMHKNE